MTQTEKKLEALKAFLIEEGEATPEELETATPANTYNTNWDTFEVIGNEYKVFTNEEADKAAENEIINSLWAFNADFIIKHTAFWDTCTAREANETIKALRELQGKLCESANALVKALIIDLDEFAEDAINADGRGHFLSYYDGNEYESNGLYVYRTN